MDGMDVTALDAAKIPADRLMAHFEDYETTDLLVKEVANVTPFCDSVSVHVHDSDDISEHKLISLINSVTGTAGLNVVVQFRPADCRGLLNADLASMVGIVCREDCCTPAGGGKNNPAATTVSLVDPTAAQLGLSYAACLKTDRTDGLYTTVVCTRTGEALGLVYSSKESIVAALQCGRGVYYSRSRKSLWRKGDTSGHYQTLHRLDVDCDGDALRFTVTQQSTEEDSHRGAAFCHLNTLTCWGPPRGLRHLEQTLQSRLQSAPEGSYTKRLFDDSVLLRDKLVEEAQELAEAVEKQHVAEELADVLYFAMVRATAAGVSIDDAVAELDRRTRKVTRRKGDSKAFRIAAARDILNKTDD
jgi:phosphoribosyl-ATP pyrophosphohydrolase/phosphoribosyl-AMP cyclohydrolase/histidinol dehydrogenase